MATNDSKISIAELFMALGLIVMVLLTGIGNYIITMGNILETILYTIGEVGLLIGLLYFAVYCKKQQSFKSTFEIMRYVALAMFIAVGAFIISMPLNKGFIVMTESEVLADAASKDVAALDESIKNFMDLENQNIDALATSVRNLPNGKFIPTRNTTDEEKEKVEKLTDIKAYLAYSQDELNAKAKNLTDEVLSPALEGFDFSKITTKSRELQGNVKGGWAFSYPEISKGLKKLADDLAKQQEKYHEDLNIFKLVSDSYGQTKIELFEDEFEPAYKESSFAKTLRGLNGISGWSIACGVVLLLLILCVYIATPGSKVKKYKGQRPAVGLEI